MGQREHQEPIRDDIDLLAERMRIECEQQGGHAYVIVGEPPWACTFCGHRPDLSACVEAGNARHDDQRRMDEKPGRPRAR